MTWVHKKRTQTKTQVLSEPMVGLEPTTSGLQIRFLSSTPHHLRPLRARFERHNTTLMHRCPLLSVGVAVTVAVKRRRDILMCRKQKLPSDSSEVLENVSIEFDMINVNSCTKASVEKSTMSPFKDPERRKEFHRKYHKEIWYPTHKQERIERSKRQKLELTKWYREYKKTLHCEDCGQNHPATLEFHHTDPTQKDFNVSRLIAQSTSLRRLKVEMAKCVVLCANCHRIRHWNERQELDEFT